MIFESLDPLLHFPGRVTVSMLVEPIPPAQAYQALRQERSSRYADRCYTGLIARSQQGRLSEPAAVADLQSMEQEDEEGYYTGATDLVGWLALAVGELTPDERNAVTEGSRPVMADASVVQEIRPSWRKGVDQMPVLSDLYTALLIEEHKAARDVAARLKEYAVGRHAHPLDLGRHDDLCRLRKGGFTPRQVEDSASSPSSSDGPIDEHTPWW